MRKVLRFCADIYFFGPFKALAMVVARRTINKSRNK